MQWPYVLPLAFFSFATLAQPVYAGPKIRIVDLEPGDSQVCGVVKGNFANKKVVLWAETDIYYVQPFISDPFTDIDPDGKWCNSTHPWVRMIALLVNKNYGPGSIRSYHPSTDAGVVAWDEEPRKGRFVKLKGTRWWVKRAIDVPEAPPDGGGMLYSDSSKCVWKNRRGLHLTTCFENGQWHATEVVSSQAARYGTFTVKLGSKVSREDLNSNAVVGLFLYRKPSQELDIEFSPCLVPPPDDGQYVVQPFTRPGNIWRYQVPSTKPTTHRITWLPDRVEFVSWKGKRNKPRPKDIIASWTYTGPDIPPLHDSSTPEEIRFRMNVWSCDGNPPPSMQPDHVIIKDVKFVPSKQ